MRPFNKLCPSTPCNGFPKRSPIFDKSNANAETFFAASPPASTSANLVAYARFLSVPPPLTGPPAELSFRICAGVEHHVERTLAVDFHLHDDLVMEKLKGDLNHRLLTSCRQTANEYEQT